MILSRQATIYFYIVAIIETQLIFLLPTTICLLSRSALIPPECSDYLNYVRLAHAFCVDRK